MTVSKDFQQKPLENLIFSTGTRQPGVYGMLSSAGGVTDGCGDSSVALLRLETTHKEGTSRREVFSISNNRATRIGHIIDLNHESTIIRRRLDV